MAFKKGFDPNRNYGGRPKGSGNKKLTQSEMDTLNRLLGKVTGEAVNLIVQSMRDDTLPMKERVASAKTLITTKIQTDQIVEKRNSGSEDNDDEVREPSVVNLVWNNDFNKDDKPEESEKSE